MSSVGTADVGQPEVFREVVTGLFRPGGNLKDLVAAHWTDNAVFKTPMFTLTGKDNLYHLFHLWQNVFDDKLQVLDVASQGDKVMVKICHNLTLRPVNIAKHLLPQIVQKLLNFPLIISATLETVQTARGRRISAWIEDVSIYTLIYNIFWFNKLFNVHNYVELGLGQGIILLDQIGRQAYHMTAPYLLPVVDRGLQTVDATVKDWFGWETHLYRSSRHIWS